MEEEAFFIYDDDVEERNKVLNDILSELKRKPKLYDKKAKFLKYYVDSLIISAKQGQNVQEPLIKSDEQLISKIQEPIESKHEEFKVTKIERQEPSLIIRTTSGYSELEKIKQIEIPASKEADFSGFMQEKMQHLMAPPPKPVGNKMRYAMPPPPRPVGVYAAQPKVQRIQEKIEVKDNDIIFKVEEGKLSQINSRVLDGLKVVIDSQEKMQFFDDLFLRAIKKMNIKENEVEKEKIKEFLERDISGLGMIDALFKNLKVRGIYCYGLNIPVLIDHSELGNVKTDLIFIDSIELNRLIANIARLAGREMNENNPIVEGVLKSGERAQLTFGTDFLNAKFVILR